MQNSLKGERMRIVAYVRRLIDDTADRDGEDIVQDVMVIQAKIFFGSFGRHHKGGGPGSCGYGPWPGRRHGFLSRQEKKHFERYWREEGKTAFEEYMKRADAEKKYKDR